jgi:hypothetical protein
MGGVGIFLRCGGLDGFHIFEPIAYKASVEAQGPQIFSPGDRVFATLPAFGGIAGLHSSQLLPLDLRPKLNSSLRFGIYRAADSFNWEIGKKNCPNYFTVIRLREVVFVEKI